ncbi:hypothetical protein N0V83_002214 [Neocucurbitaria cava]|uniref:EGF-like domain-containing protein n=1 Tax=Neocucurbitaria cava TaxID=798079 RepID=A0A9W8YDN9_9PLEO|nr:hypothetical protein N0V83_002214 [Neocucurbitaria cava]
MQLGTLLLRHLLISSVVTLALPAAPCTNDEDCSLNGLCHPRSQTCHCDPGWTGPSCSALDLSPATRGTGYNHTTYTDPTYYKSYGNSSWGGQIVQDRHNKKLFHLLVDQFSHGCGLGGWRPTSFVARAESTKGPQGPYEWVEGVTGSFRHNAYVHWSPADQAYLLWTIGVDVPPDAIGSCKSVSKDAWPNNISVAAAPEITGPWTRFHVAVNGTNPAPWPLLSTASKKIALAAEDFKIYTADRWDSNEYQLVHAAPPWNTSDYAPTWTEDPFLWRDKRGNWHALAHWMIDIVESKNRTKKYPRVGTHMFARSLEGPWKFTQQEAFSSVVAFTDGSVETFNRRERPKLFFSDDDGEVTPLYLVTGVQPLGTSSLSYTLIQPIGQAWRKFEEELGWV